MGDLVSDVVERLRPGQPAVVEPLTGGITNANFKVNLGAEQVVVRVPGNNTEVLGIDRASEVAANRAAAAVGIAPEVVAVDEETGCIVTRFVEGRPIPMAELATEPTLGAVIATLAAGARCRVGRRPSSTTSTSSAPTTTRSQRRGVPEALRLRPGQRCAGPHRGRTACSGPSVLGHNDLLNANMLHDGSIRILDWEYAGMADPYFDLANFSVNNELGSEHDDSIIRHYFGTSTSPSSPTLALMKLVSEVREAMWAVVQIAISELEVDFVAYANERSRTLRGAAGGDGARSDARPGRYRAAQGRTGEQRFQKPMGPQAEGANPSGSKSGSADNLAADESPEDADLDAPAWLDLVEAGR